jgi:anti-sigma factor RsiW
MMTDCPSAEIRDRLPDLLHERLDTAERVVILAHLEGCADCRAELALLRDLRGAMAHTSGVDVARIVAALPRPAARHWRMPVTWRIAASIAILAVGGTSVATLMHGRGGASLRSGPTASELAVTGLGDLSVPELQTLVSDISVFDALPSAEPDVVAPPIPPAPSADAP